MKLTITSNFDAPDPTFDINAAGFAARKDALELTASIVAVTDDTSLAECVAAASLARELIDACAAAHKEAKAPLAVAVKRLDGIKSAYADALDVERNRLNALASAYMTEKTARERKEREADAARIAQETAAAAESGDTDKLRELAQERNRLEVKPVASGALVRESWDYEVLDIAALAKTFPLLVKVEPRRALILGAIANGEGLPGLRIFQVAKVHAQ